MGDCAIPIVNSVSLTERLGAEAIYTLLQHFASAAYPIDYPLQASLLAG